MLIDLSGYSWGRRGRDRMVVGFTSCEFEPHSWRGVLDIILCDKVCQ